VNIEAEGFTALRSRLNNFAAIFASDLAESKESEHRNDYDNKTDNIDDVVHVTLPWDRSSNALLAWLFRQIVPPVLWLTHSVEDHYCG